MFLHVALLVLGLAILPVAADQLVLGAARLATRTGISPVVIGVVVIGAGTSMPEFLVSGLAATRGDAGIALGNLAGSNIINLALILGIAGLIAPVVVHAAVIRREVRLAVVGTFMFAVSAWIGLNRWTGMFLLLALIVAVFFLVRWARSTPVPALAADVAAETGPTPSISAVREIVRSLAGLLAVLGGAQLLVVGASYVAASAGVSQSVIGLTVVALGTSLPELVTTVQGQRRGEQDLVVGNLFGSNLFNSLAGGAIVGLLARGPSELLSVTLAVTMIIGTVLAAVLLRRRLHLARLEAMILLVFYLVTLPVVL